MEKNKQQAIKLAYRSRFEGLKEWINEDGVFVGGTDNITYREFKEWDFITNTKVAGFNSDYKKWIFPGQYYFDSYQNLGLTHYQKVVKPNNPIY